MRSLSSFLIEVRIRVSISVFVKLIILAAAFTPPIFDARREVFAANFSFITRSSSLTAPGSTVSIVAIRLTISAWMSSGSNVRTSAPNPKSR